MLQQIVTRGAFLLAFSGLIFLWNLVQSWAEGPIAEEDPWELDAVGQLTNEWQWFARRHEESVTDGKSPASPYRR